MPMTSQLAITLRPGACRGISTKAPAVGTGGGVGSRKHEAIVGGLEHRGEHLAPRDLPSAVDSPDDRVEPPLAQQRGRGRLGVVAGDEVLAAHDEIGDVALGLRRDLGAVQQGHHDRGMHVEGQGRRRAALAERLVGERVAEEADAGAAEFLGHAQLQEAFLAQPVVVLGRMRGVAVVHAGARGEIGGELSHSAPATACAPR